MKNPLAEVRLKIKNHIENNVALMRIEANCNHEWIKFGFGYACTICGHYTGLNKEHNELIKEGLTPTH